MRTPRSHKPHRRAVVSGMILAACLLARPTQGLAAYPERVITAVVPFGVGGSSDVIARIVSAQLAKELGRPVVVVNKPGAAGNVGMTFVAHSKPDGYTLLFTANAATQNPAMYRTMPYDPRKDLIGVAQDGAAYQVVAVNADKVKARTLVEFIDYLKQNPDKLNAAAGGLSTRLAAEAFRIKNDLRFEILPYNSAGDAATAVLTGEAQLMVVDPAALMPGISSGKIVPLAVTSAQRVPILPNVPTVQEAGLPFYEDFTFHGMFVPAGTPPDVIAKLHEAMSKVAKQPEIIAQFAKLGWQTVDEPAGKFQQYYLSELDKWKDVVQQAKIPPVD